MSQIHSLGSRVWSIKMDPLFVQKKLLGNYLLTNHGISMAIKMRERQIAYHSFSVFEALWYSTRFWRDSLNTDKLDEIKLFYNSWWIQFIKVWQARLKSTTGLVLCSSLPILGLKAPGWGTTWWSVQNKRWTASCHCDSDWHDINAFECINAWKGDGIRFSDIFPTGVLAVILYTIPPSDSHQGGFFFLLYFFSHRDSVRLAASLASSLGSGGGRNGKGWGAVDWRRR